MTTRVFGGFPFEGAKVDLVPPVVAFDLARAIHGAVPSGPSRRALEALSSALMARLDDRRQWCHTPEVWALREFVEWKISVGHWPAGVRDEMQRVLAGMDRGLDRRGLSRPPFKLAYQTEVSCGPEPGDGQVVILEPGSDPPRIRDTVSADGLPVFVSRLAYWLGCALQIYTRPPFSLVAPPTIHVAMTCRTGKPIEGSASYGHMNLYVAPDCPPDLLCSLASHELFHILQEAAGGSPTQLWASLFEGGAVWAEDAVASALNRYLYDAGDSRGPGVLCQPNQTHATNEYRSALLWRYIAEQALTGPASPFDGARVYLEVLRRCAMGITIEEVIRDLFPGRVFARFLRASNGELLSAETLFGNYALACRLKDLAPGALEPRFSFAESRTAIHYPSDGTVRSLAPVVRRTGRLAPEREPLRFESVPLASHGWAHEYFDVIIAPGITSVVIRFQARDGLTTPLVQIALVDDADTTVDVLRADAPAFTRSLTVAPPHRRRVARLVIVVSATEVGGRFDLYVGSGPARPDVMITRWNAAPATEFETDYRAAPWTWTSPDIRGLMPDGTPTSILVAGAVNHLSIGLHNRGVLPVAGIAVTLDFQESHFAQNAPLLTTDPWQTALNGQGITARLDGLSLEPGASGTWTALWDPGLNWMPATGDNHDRWLCVRAVVTVPDDPNSANKRALSMFRCRLPDVVRPRPMRPS